MIGALDELTEIISVQALERQTQTVRLSELTAGMIIANDIRTMDGSVLLVKKGQELSEVLLQRMRNFHRHTPVMEVIEIIVPSDEE